MVEKMAEKSYLTVIEVAELLRIGRSSAYEAVRTGQIPSVRVGKLIRIPRAALVPSTAQSATAYAGERAAVLESEGVRNVATVPDTQLASARYDRAR